MKRILRRQWLVVTVAGLLALGVPAMASAQGGHYGDGDNFSQYSGQGFSVHQGPNGESDVNVCSTSVGAGSAACGARVVTKLSSSSLAPAAPVSTSTGGSSPTISCTSTDTNKPLSLGGNGGYDPCYLQSAYNAAALAEANGGKGQIVAIVDYSVDTKIASDLAAYRAQFGLPACPTGTVSASNTGCVFQQVAQSGAPTSGRSGWDVEISLDVDAVSAICPNCQILLIEASSASFSSLGSAVNTAVADHAIAVSNSYGASDSSSLASTATAYYQHPGVAVVASSGDAAGVVNFPSSAPDVVAVGGTTLLQSTNAGTRNGATESVWNNSSGGAGAGCSAQTAPSWQSTFISNAGGSALCSTRVTADVSAVADPVTGLWIYDTYSQNGWLVVGGTSLASPVVAGLYGLMNNAPGSSLYPGSVLYADASNFYHVTSGNVGSCGNYLCDATKSINGYNGPAGLGTPGGASALSAFNFNPAVAPGVPGTPVAGTPTATSVPLTWTAASAATSYNVYWSTSSTLPGSPQATAVSSPSFTVTGLSPSTTYNFWVQAVNTVGSTLSANYATATTTAPTAPSAPTLTSATVGAAGTGSVTLNWTAPTSNGGSAITGYTVYDGTTSSLGTTVSTSVSASATSYTVSGLTLGTTYYFAVAARNTIGTGLPSNVLSATPKVAPPSTPTGVTLSASGSTVTVRWSASTGATPITYSVLVSTSSSMSRATTYSAGSNTSYAVNGLSTGTTYYFEVVATNSGGSSSPTTPLSSRG